MARVLEFMSMLFLGILLVLAFTHFLNGTFSQWVGSKFTTHDPAGKFLATDDTVDSSSSGGGGGRPPLVT